MPPDHFAEVKKKVCLEHDAEYVMAEAERVSPGLARWPAWWLYMRKCGVADALTAYRARGAELRRQVAFLRKRIARERGCK